MADPRDDSRNLSLSGPVGYVAAGEEHSASALVLHGQQAEAAGFSFLFVSDHFHPWNFEQGHGSSVWPVLGALSLVTQKALLVSAVSCPGSRLHPTTLAQAAATVQALSEGRFVLGLGTGENLNEHITGELWPAFPQRQERLEEAVGLLRTLFCGEETSHHGAHFTVERAQLFDPPASLPIAVAASGPKAAALAGRLGDALISLGDDESVVRDFEDNGGRGKLKLTQLSVCWAQNHTEARHTAHRLWPVVALEGTQFARLKTPSDFEQACRHIREDDVAAAIVCGPDPEPYKEAIAGCLNAGFDGVALHQIGPDQDGFFGFWQRELQPWVTKQT